MGPLEGFKIIEIAGIGPGQMAGMLLADMGARLIRIDRPFDGNAGFTIDPRYDVLNRSRPIIGVDLKTKEGSELVLDLCEDADAIFEGFRPGVMERLGLGPEECMERNPKLVYGRMTGWGQDGPLADSVGHDPNFLALTGIYSAIGEKGGDPVYPLNLIGDMGGGGAYLVMGMLAALLEAGKSGKGQVVDAAMVDGATSLMTMIHGFLAAGMWKEERGTNTLDGGAPFARAYRTLDNKYIAIAPFETKFFKVLLKKLGLVDLDPGDQFKQSEWARFQKRFEEVFITRTRDEWCDLFEGADACFAPILGIHESMEHPHNKARGTYVTVDGIKQAAPAPKFSRTHSEISSAAGPASNDIKQVLEQWGASEKALKQL